MNDLSMPQRARSTPVPHLPIAIIGAGFGGIGLAIKLREAGIGDFTIFEKAGELGGTWRDNRYPGCACDVPSVLYSYSFAQNPDWSRKYGEQPEILDYLRDVAGKHGIEPHIRYGHELLDASWDESAALWKIETSQGEFTASVLVSACGPFNDPMTPPLPGIETFKGKSFHTARWNAQHDLSGERVAVIGTGATAVQVVPAIQARVKQLLVFQRTPTWIVPRWDRQRSAFERALTRRVPGLNGALRTGWFLGIESLGLSLFLDRRFVLPFEALARYQLRRQVPDAALRAKLTPKYRLGCKRAVFSDAFYPALAKPNVELVTEGIAEVRAHSIVTKDGREHAVDTIIFATGFHVPGKIGEKIHARYGRSIAQVFGSSPGSYLGTTFEGFPNLFMMLGPYSAAGNQSAIYMLENQMRYIVDALRTMRSRGIATVEPRWDVQRNFVTEMVRRSRDTTWVTGGCKSYYQNPEGGNGGLWPDWSFRYSKRTRRFDVENYVTQTARANNGAVEA
ncbi:MAG: flavin-containing monooxygenase [Panacagrimonas sp.]